MLPVHTILFPTDFSENAQQAFSLACSLARDCGARIVVLYVVPPPLGQDKVLIERDPDEYYEGPLKALHEIQSRDADVRVEHRLEDGDAAKAILRVAEDIQAGLIVLGTHGRSGLGRLLVGSVAEHVLREATCPVLTVKKGGTASRPKTILFATDFSDACEGALNLAFALARDYRARLIVLHVTVPEPAQPYADFAKTAEQSATRRRQLEEELRQCQKPDCNAEFRLEEGEPEDAILRVASELSCDLIVMGTHGRTGLRRLLMGSVAEKILRRAPCPVLLVKNTLLGRTQE